MEDKIKKWFSNFEGLIPSWESDRKFMEVYAHVVNRPAVCLTRCYILFQFLSSVCDLKGDVAEVGVFRGKTAKIIALTANKKHVHLFDTFEGMPQHDPEKDPRWVKGTFKADINEVRNFLSGFGNISIYKGIFPATSEPIKDKNFAFVHIDVDIYQSCKDCSEFFYPRMVPGGIILYDDPGFADCKGAKIAVDEFYDGKPEVLIYLLTGQALIIKR